MTILLYEIGPKRTKLRTLSLENYLGSAYDGSDDGSDGERGGHYRPPPSLFTCIREAESTQAKPNVVDRVLWNASLIAQAHYHSW